MMGTQARRYTPISTSSLDDLVPTDHFYRQLDRALDLSFVRELVGATYADAGRPSIDPVVFFKLQLVMFFEGIRSERQLVRLAADRLSVHWYLGYNLDESLPDHSSLTRIRARYGLKVFRRFFEAIVEQCQQAGLVWGRELYFDATQVQANAALGSLTARFAVQAREASHAHLTALFANERGQAAHENVEAATGVAFAEDTEDSRAGDPPLSPPPTRLPVDLPATVRQELTRANAARHDWIAEHGRQQRAVRGGASSVQHLGADLHQADRGGPGDRSRDGCDPCPRSARAGHHAPLGAMELVVSQTAACAVAAHWLA